MGKVSGRNASLRLEEEVRPAGKINPNKGLQQPLYGFAVWQLPPYSGNYGGTASVQNTVVMITVVNNCK